MNRRKYERFNHLHTLFCESNIVFHNVAKQRTIQTQVWSSNTNELSSALFYSVVHNSWRTWLYVQLRGVTPVI